jgi:hypothetical protein
VTPAVSHVTVPAGSRTTVGFTLRVPTSAAIGQHLASRSSAVAPDRCSTPCTLHGIHAGLVRIRLIAASSTKLPMLEELTASR